ncbi:hypothetical protein [Notoacmeibacter ruber]|nr:hypothetical protein [Notoacmeibacter ruber]
MKPRTSPLFLLAALAGWPAVCAASTIFTVLLRRHQSLGSSLSLIGVQAFGGLVAVVVWLVLQKWWIARFKKPATRFILSFIALAALTAGACAGIFALQFWAYFRHWHEPIFSHIGLIQFVWTISAAIYQYAVLGVRQLVPLAMPAGAILSLLVNDGLRIEAHGRIR